MLLDFGELIIPKYDFAYDTTNFLFNSLYEMYQYQVKGELTESKINIFMHQDSERKNQYEKIKGYQYIRRIMAAADLDEFQTYYNNLKKYSLLRELELKGFPAKKIFEKNNFSKVTPENILHGMEMQIINIGTVIGGAQDSVILGRKMTERVKEWKKKPDFGLEIPFELINMLLRGLRKKKLTLTGMHSGCGKSRLTSKVACYLGIFKGVNILVAANEQDEDEWDAMVISCIINNPEFHFKPNSNELNEVGELIYEKGFQHKGIDETKIVTGTLTKDEDEIVMAAAEYIEEHSKIHFLELSKYDEVSLKRHFKKHKIKKCELIIYDTLKAPDHDWMSFVKTGDMLKEQAKELDISFWATFQLTDDSLFNEILNSTAIANGKHIKHIADGLMMFRPLFPDDYDKYVIYNPSSKPFVEERRRLDRGQTYYMGVIDKNRGGKDKDLICFRVDKGKNIWIEEGYLILSDIEKDFIKTKKEFNKLKKEQQVHELKEKLGKA